MYYFSQNKHSKTIEKYLKPQDAFITCVFGEMDGGKIIQKGTYAKMTRGEMVRFMAENKIEDLDGIKKFDRLSYRFQEQLSNKNEYIFIKDKRM